jgi:hypothetical protein
MRVRLCPRCAFAFAADARSSLPPMRVRLCRRCAFAFAFTLVQIFKPEVTLFDMQAQLEGACQLYGSLPLLPELCEQHLT